MAEKEQHIEKERERERSVRQGRKCRETDLETMYKQTEANKSARLSETKILLILEEEI